MGSEEEPELSSTPKLPLLSIPPIEWPESSGMRTPPLHTSASVPFWWEEKPGKPRHCTALTTTTATLSDDQTTGTPGCGSHKCLELPPRLQSMDNKMTKMSSPTTVLEGPTFGSSSFRFRREHRGCPFGSSCGSTERGQHDSMMVLSKKLSPGSRKGRGFIFGSWSRNPILKRGKKDIDGGNLVSSSSMDLADFGVDEGGSTEGKKVSGFGMNGRFSRVSHQARSQFWATIYNGFKHVLPWKSTKSKKDGAHYLNMKSTLF
ncbi:hypothetical protein U1Q18_023735 [Sarracenia purpurea var. burkii]